MSVNEQPWSIHRAHPQVERQFTITVLLPSHDGIEPCNAVGLNQRIVEHISDMGALHLPPRDGALPIVEVATVVPEIARGRACPASIRVSTEGRVLGCALDIGHGGQHVAGDGTWWTDDE